jgi:hypothetical protein
MGQVCRDVGRPLSPSSPPRPPPLRALNGATVLGSAALGACTTLIAMRRQISRSDRGESRRGASADGSPERTIRRCAEAIAASRTSDPSSHPCPNSLGKVRVSAGFVSHAARWTSTKCYRATVKGAAGAGFEARSQPSGVRGIVCAGMPERPDAADRELLDRARTDPAFLRGDFTADVGRRREGRGAAAKPLSRPRHRIQREGGFTMVSSIVLVNLGFVNESG